MLMYLNTLRFLGIRFYALYCQSEFLEAPCGESYIGDKRLSLLRANVAVIRCGIVKFPLRQRMKENTGNHLSC